MLSNNEYVPYERIIDNIPVEAGDTIYLTSQVLDLAKVCKANGERFDPNKFIDSIQNKVCGEGNILIPTFNWDFSNKGTYDWTNAICTTGSLGKAALSRDDFTRTINPMDSFAVWGKDAAILANTDNYYCYGEDSPFAFMLQNGAKCLMCGTNYKDSYTFIHYVEYREKVPYRYDKEFVGTYIDRDGNISTRKYNLYVRDLNVCLEENFNRIGSVMEEMGISHKYSINNIDFTIIDIAKSYEVIAKDIHNNNCNNLYIFS